MSRRTLQQAIDDAIRQDGTIRELRNDLSYMFMGYGKSPEADAVIDADQENWRRLIADHEEIIAHRVTVEWRGAAQRRRRRFLANLGALIFAVGLVLLLWALYLPDATAGWSTPSRTGASLIIFGIGYILGRLMVGLTMCLSSGIGRIDRPANA